MKSILRTISGLQATGIHKKAILLLLLPLLLLFANVEYVYGQCPATVTTQPKDSTVCTGNNASFSIVATSTTDYQWQVSTNGGTSWTDVANGGVYSGATSTSLLISGAVLGMTNYQYRCQAINTTNTCSTASAVGKLIVNQTPYILTTTPGYACAGGVGQVNATGAPANPSTIIKWYDQATGGTLLGTGNTLNIPISPVATTNYYAHADTISALSTGSLSAQLGATNNQLGCFTDLKPLADIRMTDVSWVPVSTQSYDISIYFKAGTSVGFETSSGAWTLIGSQTGISATAGTPHKIALSSPQNMTANTVYSILVISTGSSGNIHYQTVTTLGAVETQNSDLQIITAKGISGLFSGSLFSPRQLACVIWYEKGNKPLCPPTSTRVAVPLNIDALPVITTQPVNTSICNNNNGSFSVTAVNVDTYQWQVSTNGGVNWTDIINGGAYSNATTATLNITAATLSMHNYQYRCVLTTACNLVSNTNAATLDITVQPAITLNPVDKMACLTDNLTFTAAATGSGVVYQWQISTDGGTIWNNISNGGAYSNATTNTLSVSNVTTAMDNNLFRCVATGVCPPNTRTTEASIKLYELPHITAHPQDDTYCSSGNASFSCTATGDGLTYQWQESTNGGVSYTNIANGGIYSNANTATLNLTGATAGMDDYRYRCVVSGNCPPAATTNGATLILGDLPAVTTQPVDVIACTGFTNTFSITATGFSIGYQWQESIDGGTTWANVTNGGVYSNATTNILSITNPPLSMSSYQYRAVVSNTCAQSVNSAAAVLTVADAPVVVTQPVNSTICEGANTQYTVVATSAAPIIYQWQGSNNGTTWSNLQNHTYYSGVNTATLDLTTPNSGAYNMYRCVINTGCVPATITNAVSLTIQSQPTITYNPVNKVICEGQNANFQVTATGSILSYQWQESTDGGLSWANITNGGVYAGANTFNLTLTTINNTFDDYRYRCVVSGACPTVKTSTAAALTVNTTVVVSSNPTPAITLCSGDNTSLSVTAAGTGIAYNWYVNDGTSWTLVTNGGFYSGATTGTLNITGITASPNTKIYAYYCVVSGTCGGNTTPVTYITVNAKPAIAVQPADLIRCDSTHNANFSVTATGTNLSYQWEISTDGGNTWSTMTNNSTYQGTTTSQILLPNVYTTMDNFQYRCIISGTCAPSVTTNAAILNVNGLVAPGVSIVTTSDDICAGESVTFTPTPVNGGSTPTYEWRRNNVPIASGSTFTSTTLAQGDVISCAMTSSIACPSPRIVLSNSFTMDVTPVSPASVSIATNVGGNSWCTGKPIEFNATPNNGGQTPSYQWYLNNSPIGIDANNLALPAMNNGDVVKCEMISSLRCFAPNPATSNIINMTINQTTSSSIVIAANPDSVICDNTEVLVSTAFTNGGAVPSFQWMLNGIDIPGETNGTLRTTALANGDVVNCVLTSSATCVFPQMSNELKFTVVDVVDPKIDLTVIYDGNNSYTFTALPTFGGPNPNYQWYRNGNKLANETGATYTASNLVSSDRIYVEMASSEQCVNPALNLVRSKTITTGIGQMPDAIKELGLYPNPNTGQFTVSGELNTAMANKEVVINITNALGQTIYTQVYAANGTNLNIPITLKETVANGMYTVNLTIDKETTNIRFVLSR